MPQQRPAIVASSVTAVAAALIIGLTGGHSPFGTVIVSAGQPVADADLGLPTDSPAAIALVPDEPEATPKPTKKPSKASATPRPKSTSTKAKATAKPATAATPKPAGAAATPKPTPKPTLKPTPKPTLKPTAPPASDSPTLTVGVSRGNPVLSWTTCTSSAFDGYAVVRSTDHEIHFPAEDHDTVVAIVTSRSSTSLTDAGAPSGVRVWYGVWCVRKSDGEYKSIWKTPTVSVTP